MSWSRAGFQRCLGGRELCKAYYWMHPCSPLPKNSPLAPEEQIPVVFFFVSTWSKVLTVINVHHSKPHVLHWKQNAVDAHPEAVFLQKGLLGKIKGLWMQRSFNTNCLGDIMALNKEFKPRAGHGSSWFRLPRAWLLTACSFPTGPCSPI